MHKYEEKIKKVLENDEVFATFFESRTHRTLVQRNKAKIEKMFLKKKTTKHSKPSINVN